MAIIIVLMILSLPIVLMVVTIAARHDGFISDKDRMLDPWLSNDCISKDRQEFIIKRFPESFNKRAS